MVLQALTVRQLKATIQRCNSNWAHVMKGEQTQPTTPASVGTDQTPGHSRTNRLICPPKFSEGDAPTDISATYVWADDLLLPAEHSKECFV